MKELLEFIVKNLVTNVDDVKIEEVQDGAYTILNVTFQLQLFQNNKTMMPILTTFIQYSFGSPSYSNQRRKRN